MAVSFFYFSSAAVLLVLLLCAVKKGVDFKHLIIAIAGMGYSLFYETLLGEVFELYHYIHPDVSLIYIIIGAVSIYPAIEVIYTLFLPERPYAAIIYTVAWTALLLVFELASIYTKTLVLTGWKVFPWSIVTYIITFVWINLLFRYLKKRGL